MLTLNISGAMLWQLVILLPGILVALALSKEKSLLNRLIAGLGLGFVAVVAFGALITVFNIPFSMYIVYGVLLVEYGIAAFFLYKKWNDVTALFNEWQAGFKEAIKKTDWKYFGIALGIILVLYYSYILRFTTVSPIYYELDPYYYLYISTQLLSPSTGHIVPAHDTTAWYPVINDSHRDIPGLAFYQALFFALNEGKATLTAHLDLYKLAFYANFYPPLVGLLMAGFVYLAFSRRFSPGAALMAAIIVVTTPSVLNKTLSGVFEAQPMSFMAHTLFLMLLFLAVDDDVVYRALIFLVGVVYTMASTQAIIGAFVLLIAAGLYFAFYRENEGFERAIEYGAWGLALGALLMVVWTSASLLSIGHSLPLLVGLGVGAALWGYRNYKKDVHATIEEITKRYGNLVLYTIYAIILLVSIGVIWHIAKGGLSVGEYRYPLQRTIAEQQPTGMSLQGTLGFVGYEFMKTQKTMQGVLLKEKFPILSTLLSYISDIFEIIFKVSLALLEKTGAVIVYEPKIPNLGFIIWGGALLYAVYLTWKGIANHWEGEDAFGFILAILAVGITIPGFLKAKYVVHTAFFLSLFGGYSLALLYDWTKRWLSKMKDGETYMLILYGIAALLVVFVLDVNLYGNGFNIPLLYYSVVQKPAYNPAMFAQAFGEFCHLPCGENITVQQLCYTNHSFSAICKFYPGETPLNKVCQDPNAQHLCALARGNVSIAEQYSSRNCALYFSLHAKQTTEDSVALTRACGVTLPEAWLSSMDWLYENTLKNARITSWWDYGHWINYWARRNAVIRNDHRSHYMIGEVAYAYIMAPIQDFDAITAKFHSDYALFDREILFGGQTFGGKFYALNYLACADRNLTTVKKGQLQSQCEIDNLWEGIYVTNEDCTISPITGQKGKVAVSFRGSPQYGYKKAYCVGLAQTLEGKILATYYLNKTNSHGELVLNKAFLLPVGQNTYILIYTKDPVWYVNGTYANGWSDRKGRFYDSMVYRAYILNELPGWIKVYDNGYVKIYKRNSSAGSTNLNNSTSNSATSISSANSTNNQEPQSQLPHANITSNASNVSSHVTNTSNISTSNLSNTSNKTN